MRIPFLALAAALSLADAALAQAPPPPPSPPAAASPTVEGVTRDQYIDKAREAAAKRAGTRFDAMDANHDGLLTKDEIAAYRAAHRRHPADQ